MRVVPLTLKEANELITKLHRHHHPVQGHRYSLGARMDSGLLCGAVGVGRPVARMGDPYTVAEGTRLVTDGTPNACSFLYGAAARVAKEMGFLKIQTYILEAEPGTSLKASGWTFDRVTSGGQWKHTAGPRRMDQPICPKQRWVKILNG